MQSAVFLDANSFPKAESELAELAESIVGDGINIFESEDAIDAAFEEAGYGFLGAEDLLELLIKYEYVFYGDYVVKNAKSYAKLCAQIVEDEFPEGITNSDEDLNRLRALAKVRYGDLDIPSSNRSFFTRITVHLVLRGRSQYIAPRYIYADEAIIAEIKAYIDASKQRDLHQIFELGHFLFIKQHRHHPPKTNRIATPLSSTIFRVRLSSRGTFFQCLTIRAESSTAVFVEYEHTMQIPPPTSKSQRTE